MGLFDTSLLYVLSGTGNTYRVACWIRDYFEKKGIKTRLKFIENADFQGDFQNSDKQLTTVLFPTHGFMPPWSMIKFLLRMHRQKKVPVMSVATRGAVWVGPVKIPGAAGFSNFFAAMILLFKGYDIRGFFSLWVVVRQICKIFGQLVIRSAMSLFESMNINSRPTVL